MVEIYSVCGKWNLNDKSQWKFLVDTNKGGSLCEVDENITYKDLVEMVIEDFGIDCSVKNRDITLSYELPLRMKSMVEDSPPMYMRNDRQVRTFIKKVKEDHELIRLCVTVSNKCNFIEDVGENVGNNIQANTVHNEENYDVEKTRRTHTLQNLEGGSCVNESNMHDKQQEFHQPTDRSVSVTHNDTSSTSEKGNHPSLLQPAPDVSPFSHSISTRVTSDLHVKKCFKNKQELMLKMRKWALEWKFEFKSLWSNKSRVVLGCVDDKCSWRMRATKLGSSDSFVVKKYVHEHSCDTTHRSANHRQATAKLLGTLICNNYGEEDAGLKPKQIIEQIRKEHGFEIKYQKAWRVREQVQNLIRETPDYGTEILCAPRTTSRSSGSPPKKRMRSDGVCVVPGSESPLE